MRLRKRPEKRHRWSTDPRVQQLKDDEIIRLLEEVENEFQASYEYHAQRLRELREALRDRQTINRQA